ncbi:cyclic pyranopterin monophosphate synthase MoaC [Zooshikella marina]|uniref:cyclic pyranopterin monophosphate synthase MoaC n=1 Tax=Zooshikella ganghwensis TaxID=202772 RepID=UPI001BB011E7|nr:cyclic pyranopterin monophosphate synthase MoaC [Zooshikella ganghwensis]MBU2705067.1 cyclic pyranopterin monophosphate synthase MoaC [Zooshikella ganghwensis]
MTKTSPFTHLDKLGQAHMVDITEKQVTSRTATAQSIVGFSADSFNKLTEDNPKGDVFAVARIAGIQAAKRCADLIPLCHSLALSNVSIDFNLLPDKHQVQVLAQCKLAGKTGVEMEALTAASIAALTLYDMCKAFDKGIVIEHTCLLEKTGGKSGHWQRTTS